MGPFFNIGHFNSGVAKEILALSPWHMGGRLHCLQQQQHYISPLNWVAVLYRAKESSSAQIGAERQHSGLNSSFSGPNSGLNTSFISKAGVGDICNLHWEEI